MTVAVRPGGLDDPRVRALIGYHQAEAHASTPAANAHALDVEGLRGLDFFTAWDGDTVVGIGALKEFAPGHAELKSMRTHPDYLRKGVARAMLGALLERARARGCTRVSLETGTAPMFAAANALYDAAGFVDGPVFGDYPASPHNRFMTLVL